MDSVILSNQIKCLSCGESIYSVQRHDFQTCSCGKSSVDGGMAYLRRVGDSYTEESIVISQETCDDLIRAIGSKDHNNLGKLCYLAREIRDIIGINISEKDKG